jgi:competence protein ComFC
MQSESSPAFTSLLARSLRAAVDLLYPERCAHCGEFGSVLCAACEVTMTSAPTIPRCPFCRARWSGQHNCPRCFHMDALEGARAPFDYDGPARSAVRTLKYRNALALAPVMARHVAPLVTSSTVDAVFSVPLHTSRLRNRGFNQSERILAALNLAPPPGKLVRTKKTRAQFGLGIRDRAQNVAGAFRYEGDELTGLRVAIFDDVITTGVTANECARVLRDAGAREVIAIAFARANYDVAEHRPIRI